MKLIVGLGNPGSRYSGTRHNAGRSLLEWMAEKSKADFKVQKKLKASTASIHLGSEETLLAYPEMFMNVSGEAVSLLTQAFPVDISKDLLIVSDDVAIPFGKFRLRSKGSDGGHNGLKSITEFLKTSQYPRLRFGIGMGEENLPLEEFVLSVFEKGERQDLPGIYEKGLAACFAWANQPIAKAMNSVNA